MKKVLLAAALSVATFFGAQAQFGIAGEYNSVSGGAYAGAMVKYIMPMGDNLGVGGQIGYQHGLISGVTASMIPIEGEFRFYAGGDQESGGLYGKANLGLTRYSYKLDLGFLGGLETSGMGLSWGIGGGFKTEGGLDLFAQYKSVSQAGGSGGLIGGGVGMFF